MRGGVEQGIQSVLRNFLSTNNMKEMGVLPVTVSLDKLEQEETSPEEHIGRV